MGLCSRAQYVKGINLQRFKKQEQTTPSKNRSEEHQERKRVDNIEYKKKTRVGKSCTVSGVHVFKKGISWPSP